MKASKCFTAGIDAALALTYWALVFHSEYFYGPHRVWPSVVYGLLLLLFVGAKIRFTGHWMENIWVKRHPYFSSLLSVFVSGYLVFFSFGLTALFEPIEGISVSGNYGFLFALPLVFMLYGAAVVVPLWAGLSLALGCCLRRAGRAV